jgi:hypothetical protein
MRCNMIAQMPKAGRLKFYTLAGQFLNNSSRIKRAAIPIRELPSVTRRDQELLDKQFRWLDRSPGGGLLALSVFSAILLCVFLGSAIIA